MFIDTATANTRSLRPQVIISPSPYNDGSTPLLETAVGQDVPPPSYLEATTPGLFTSRMSGEEGARLLSLDGREARDAAYKEEQYGRRSLRQRCLRKPWRKLVVSVLVVVFLAVMLALMLAAVSARRDKLAMVTAPSPSAQSAEEDTAHPEGFINDDNDQPDLIAVPWPSSSASASKPTQSKQLFPIRWPAQCGKEYQVKTEEYNYDKPSELNIHEAVRQSDGPYKRVAGWIHVAKAPADQAPGTIQARMSYAVSPSIDLNAIKYITTATSLTIGNSAFPSNFDGIAPGNACLGMSIVLYMAPGASISKLKVYSTHMGMQIHSGADFTVTNGTFISLSTGTLDAASFDSRETHLRTISGSIGGMYKLHSLLSVNTKSGSINIDVEPQRGGEKDPAVFKVTSHSGSIRTDFKRKKIPIRNYQTFVNTTVGSFEGNLIHGSRTEISSVDGSVIADLLPLHSGPYQSEIYTSAQSGQTTLTLQTPYRGTNIPMVDLISTHKSTSGGINVTYPQEWSGYIDGTSSSGALHLQGKDLILMSKNDEAGENHIEAEKGEGVSMLTFQSVNGNCDVRIGNM